MYAYLVSYGPIIFYVTCLTPIAYAYVDSYVYIHSYACLPTLLVPCQCAYSYIEDYRTI